MHSMITPHFRALYRTTLITGWLLLSVVLPAMAFSKTISRLEGQQCRPGWDQISRNHG